MPAPAQLLWMDFESTGLLTDPTPPTLLEVAFTVTNTRGEQLTPLAQAFCALPTSRTSQLYSAPSAHDYGFGLAVPTLGDDTAKTGVAYWPADQCPSLFVQEMHRENGLSLEWAQFATGPDRGRILRHWQEVERILLDALDAAGWRDLGRGQVILAGGGVSHYEDRFLREFCPRVFDDKRVHYAVTDTSTVLRTLRTRALVTPGEDEDGNFPGTADRLIERYRPDMYSKGTDVTWANISLSPRRYAASDRCGYSRGVDADGTVWEKSTPHWALMDKDDHRAAPGIARALMAYRLLPRLLDDAKIGLPA